MLDISRKFYMESTLAGLGPGGACPYSSYYVKHQIDENHKFFKKSFNLAVCVATY
jgi:hypothetical protein